MAQCAASWDCARKICPEGAVPSHLYVEAHVDHDGVRVQLGRLAGVGDGDGILIPVQGVHGIELKAA